MGTCTTRVASDVSSMKRAVSFSRWASASGASASAAAAGSATAASRGPRPGRLRHEPQRLRRDEEERVVVRRERERGDGAPAQQPARVARRVERAQPQQGRQRAEQHEQRVGARLLAEPDEKRVERDQRGGGERRAVAAEPLGKRPRDTGSSAVPSSAGSERSPASPVPKTCAQVHASR